jgi:hypothetical protein
MSMLLLADQLLERCGRRTSLDVAAIQAEFMADSPGVSHAYVLQNHAVERG